MTTTRQISDEPATPGIQLTDVIPCDNNARVTYKFTQAQLVAFMGLNVQIGQSQVINLVSNLANFVPLSGGTMTGALNLYGNPTTLLAASPRQYTDAVGNGFIPVPPQCYAGTVDPLNSNYSNGSLGIGATLTDASGTFAAFTTDGTTPPLNSIIFVLSQTNPAENGVYTLTINGNGISVPWQLTRVSNFNQVANILQYSFITVVNGTELEQTEFYLSTPAPIVVGTTALNFLQYDGLPVSLNKYQNLSDLTDIAQAKINLGITPSGTLPYINVTGVSYSIVMNNGYFPNNISLVTLNMPASLTTGQVLSIVGCGSGGWKLQMNTGQIAHFGDVVSSSGGMLQSTSPGDCAYMVVAPNGTDVIIFSSVGNIVYS